MPKRHSLLACCKSEALFSPLFQMRQAGIEGTLDQIFTCPDLVKEALCDAAMLQKSVSPSRNPKVIRPAFLSFDLLLARKVLPMNEVKHSSFLQETKTDVHVA